MTEPEIRAFFDAYGAAFLESEDAIATFYSVPCITARQGTVHLNATPEAARAFFANVLNLYRSQGCAQGELREFSYITLGVNSVAATVRWAYQNAAGQLLWESTFTYNLYKGSDGWKILLQTMHDAR